MVKTLQKSSQEPATDFHETWYIGGLLLIIVCSNDDSGLTFTYFTARSNFVTGVSVEKVKKVDYSETIAACYLKLIDLMNICDN